MSKDSIKIVAEYPDGRQIKLLGIGEEHLQYIHRLMQEISDRTRCTAVNDYWYFPNPVSEAARRWLEKRGINPDTGEKKVQT